MQEPCDDLAVGSHCGFESMTAEVEGSIVHGKTGHKPAEREAQYSHVLEGLAGGERALAHNTLSISSMPTVREMLRAMST